MDKVKTGFLYGVGGVLAYGAGNAAYELGKWGIGKAKGLFSKKEKKKTA